MRRSKWMSLGSVVVLALALVGWPGCSAGGGGGGGGGDNGPDAPGDEAGAMRVNFDPDGGNYAVGEDEDGNEYTFRERDDAITEANIRMPDGSTLKASLDAQGRPVKFRSADNSNADLVYGDQGVRIRYTDAAGQVTDVTGLDGTAARERVQARRIVRQDKRRIAMQADDVPVRVTTLTRGLETFEEVTESILDEDANPTSPLIDTPLEEPIRQISRIASLREIREVEAQALADVDLDEVPDEVAGIANKTFVLFEAQGFCMAENPGRVASRLNFDNNGLLITEFDKNLLFPVSEGGTEAGRGFDINWQSSTTIPVIRADQGLGYTADVTPIYTATGVAADGTVTVERRFLAELASEVDVDFFTSQTATARSEQLFNAAFVEGELFTDDADIEWLEFDLVLIDLAGETPAEKVGRLRYYNQNGVSIPGELTPYDFRCTLGSELGTEEAAGDRLNCEDLQRLEPYQPFEISFLTRDREAELEYHWYVSSGYGYIEDPFAPVSATVVPLAEGPMEISLIVSDPTLPPEEMFRFYTCEAFIGDTAGTDGLVLGCPTDVVLGVPALFSAGIFEARQAPGDEELIATDESLQWYVLGTSDFFVEDPFAPETEITFFSTGRFEVTLASWGPDGTTEFGYCEVVIEGGDFDECEAYGLYGDGVCDKFCLYPDPDCEGDWCDELGWYGDGVCDPDCPQPDPDCGAEEFDECEAYGYYGDGVCDDFCLEPDPDCFGYDICEELGYYGDGVCDFDCPRPDPDCEEVEADWCDELGWYGDGICDPDCPQPDPDCEAQDLECVDDLDCAEGEICIDGFCEPFGAEPGLECIDDSDCDFGELCIDGFCEPFDEEPGFECIDDFDCDFDEICIDGFCESLDEEPDVECIDDSDCADDEICIDGFCEQFA